MSRVRRVLSENFPWIWASVTMLLVIATAVSIATAISAEHRAAGVAVCINDNLGKRSAPTARDAAAHIAFAQAVDALFDVPPDATMKQREQVGLTFKVEVHRYVHILLADQRERASHPLGEC